MKVYNVHAELHNVRYVKSVISDIISKYDYVISDSKTAYHKSTESYELRLKPISKTYQEAITSNLGKDLKKVFSKVEFKKQAINSGKFSSFIFTYEDILYECVISAGANQGQSFEKWFAENFILHLKNDIHEPLFDNLVYEIKNRFPSFSLDKIVKQYQKSSKSSTLRESASLYELGEIIADYIIEMKNEKILVSIKDVNGDTIANFGGIKELYNNSVLQKSSITASMLLGFGVDLTLYDKGIEEYIKKSSTPKIIDSPSNIDSQYLKTFIERSWGLGYYYVRRKTPDYLKVKWLDSTILDQLSEDLTIKEIQYPYSDSKQLTIKIHNKHIEYKVEVRNTKGLIYPNEMKVRLTKSDIL